MNNKIIFTPYSKDNANKKRIQELKENIKLYESEIKRWKQELKQIKEVS